MGLLQDNLGESFDASMAGFGYRALQIRLGEEGIFTPMPFVAQPWESDVYKKSLNKDPGYGQEDPLISSPFRSWIPFTTMARAAALEGITVTQAISVGQIYWIDVGDGVWQKVRLMTEANSNNCRWLIILDYWLP